MTRQITEIHVHHAALEADYDRAHAWHTATRADGGRGWRDVGYHVYVEASGAVRLGRPTSQIPASISERNVGALAVCVGIDGRHLDGGHRLTPWWSALVSVIADWMIRYSLPPSAIIEHRDGQQDRDCPGWPASTSEDLIEDCAARAQVIRAHRDRELARMRRAVARRT